MDNTNIGAYAVAFFLIVCSGCTHQVNSVDTITKTDIGTLGGNFSSAHDINARGYIVGESTLSTNEKRAFLYDPTNKTMKSLGKLSSGNSSTAEGINFFNQVVGSSEIVNFEGKTRAHAFLYTDDTMIDIHPDSSDDFRAFNSYARSINDNGKISGVMDIQGMIWDVKTDPTHPSTEAVTVNGEFRPTTLYDINGFDVACGRNYSSDNGFRYANSQYDDLPGGYAEGTAFAINNKGETVGSFLDTLSVDNRKLAVKWTATKQKIVLGTLGGKDSEARDINDDGVVVGFSNMADGSVHAFVWHENFGMKDLGTLGGRVSRAYAINPTVSL